ARPSAIEELLQSRGVEYIRFEDWKLIDELEVKRGQEQGRPRVKFTSVEEMLEAVRKARGEVQEAEAA
ncbi:MAG: hypothetical protein D6790_13255, partial [Caldilineae bacterium]